MKHHNEISSTNDFPIGSIVFGRYQVLSFIASGGGGRVYKVLDTIRKVEVALKVLLVESFDDKQLMRFQHEAQTASKLRHANIATVYDFGLIDGMPYLIMEFVEGLSLEEMLDGNVRLDLPEFLDIFIQITDAVVHAHHNGVIHRDIKPGNVVIREDPAGAKIAKILDFGVAKRLDTNEQQQPSGKQTPTGNIVGSPLYMSPEQARGIKVTPQSDSYSIGTMMFRCLAGHPPIQADTAIETIMRVGNIPAPSLAEEPGVDVHLPLELTELVDGLLSKDPEQRPSLEEDVLPLLKNLRSPEVEVEVEEDQEGTTGNTTPLLQNVQILSPASKAIIGVVLIFVTGGLVFKLFPLSKSETSEPISLKLTMMKDFPEKRQSESLSLKGPDVNANATNINDQDLARIEHPETVLQLRAGGTYLSTLESIGRFKNLEELEIGETEITDSALKQLVALKHLRKLDLKNTRITDNGMLFIGKLSTLEQLNLSQTGVTPIGLRKLNQLHKLVTLILQFSTLSPSDVELFASSINPKCMIDLTRSKNISMANLKAMKTKFPDITIAGQTSVVQDMTAPLDKILLQPAKTEAQLQKLQQGYQNIIAVIEKAYGKRTPRSRRYYLNMYVEPMEADAGNPKIVARRFAAYQTALELSRKAGDRQCELEALDALAFYLQTHRGYQAARTTSLQAIELANSLDPEQQQQQQQQQQQAHRFSMLALSASSANQFTDSEAYYKKAIAIEQSIDKDSRRAAVLIDSLGDCYMRMQKHTKAIECFTKTIQIFKAKGTTNQMERNAYFMANGHRAYYLMTDGRLSEALAFNQQFYRLTRKPGTRTVYAQSAIDQRIDLFEKLKRPRPEIDALLAERSERAKLEEQLKQ